MQFALTPAPRKPPPPAWIEELGKWIEWLLKPIGRFIAWLVSWLPDADWARGLLYILLALGAALIAWLVINGLRHGEWRWPWRKAAEAVGVAEAAKLDWQPDAAPARAWLDEADALAAQGRFAEALHCLLLRSVEDMARRRPRAVRPALTARELASSPLLPERARGLFGRLASGVERSLFGRRPVEQTDWAEARAAYAEYALAGTWKT
ncbi:DUF4129 domain-containing protein [Sphingomonas sp. KRR8]|uniref:DUF4129 domain-containing protein n=1 Tax=Sphingomonas sp. KRR8 TaxID=2942996 RepID=UPI002020C61F|nr:DUF4129 domain-containing protein [Sphingomonas sp. KRR8]URD60869.1 DUF4129 domain-containing protein [Sphingomonas sp. KRR8]